MTAIKNRKKKRCKKMQAEDEEGTRVEAKTKRVENWKRFYSLSKSGRRWCDWRICSNNAHTIETRIDIVWGDRGSATIFFSSSMCVEIIFPMWMRHTGNKIYERDRLVLFERENDREHRIANWNHIKKKVREKRKLRRIARQIKVQHFPFELVFNFVALPHCHYQRRLHIHYTEYYVTRKIFDVLYFKLFIWTIFLLFMSASRCTALKKKSVY